jgi:hypothetical protein
MKLLTRFASAAAMVAATCLVACSPTPEAEPLNYRELAVVMQARLAPCLNQGGFEPPWPKSDWRAQTRGADYSHPEPLNMPASRPDGARYLLHFGDAGFAVYVTRVSALASTGAGSAASAPASAWANAPVQQAWGPLPFSARCPEAPAPVASASSAASAVAPLAAPTAAAKAR